MVYPKLFVVGCPRSGTTWLRSMIIPHSTILATPEETHIYLLTYKYFTYLKKQSFRERLRDIRLTASIYGSIESLRLLLLGFTSKDIWNGILHYHKIYRKRGRNIGLHNLVSYSDMESLIEKACSGNESDLEKVQLFIQLMFDRYFENNSSNHQTILLEKTPDHIKYIDVILRQFPEAKGIEIIRDGRDVCVSYQARGKTQKWANQSTTHIIKTWKSAIKKGERAKSDPEIGDRLYSVRYENLRAHPHEELSKIFDFIGLDYDRSLINTIVDSTDINKAKNKGEGQHIRKGSVGEWKTRLSKEDIALWEELAGDTLAHLGYN